MPLPPVWQRQTVRAGQPVSRELGGVNRCTGWPRSASASVFATAMLTADETPSPTASCGLSGLAAVAAAASCG